MASSTTSTTTSSSTSPLPPAFVTLQDRAGELLRRAAPLFVLLGTIIRTLYPYFYNAWLQARVLWKLLEPYHPDEFLPILAGFVVAFFGGHYFTLFAAIEAYRLCGYEQTKVHLVELYKNYLVVLEENEKDNLVDDDNDGIADVEQITAQELFNRKIALILKSMDPVKVTSALSGFWMGFLGVVAVLRIKFAQTVALGSTIGNLFETVAGRFLHPVLAAAIPESHHKWIPVIISYTCKTIGVSVAWTIQRVISAFYSSIRGAQIFTKGLAKYFKRLGLGSYEDGSIVFTVVTGLVAWTGFAWQVQSGFRLPFPLNVLLFPLTVLEWFITWMVAVEN